MTNELADDPLDRAGDMLAELKGLLGEHEELDPELAEYMSISELGWTMIRHPLVYSVVHADAFNALVNRQLRDKKRALAEAQRTRNWHRYVYLFERPYRIDAFTNICWRLGDKRYWDLLGDIWTDMENWWQNQDLWRECLTADRRYRSHMMSTEERDILRSYRSPVTIYRGWAEGGTPSGMSWTMNRIVAKFFARRFAQQGARQFIATGTVRKTDVIAYLEGRSEYEVVVLPENVRNIEVTEL